MYDVTICVQIICKQLMSWNMLQTLHPCQSCSSAHLLSACLRDNCFLDITTVVKHCRSCSDVCWKIYCHSAFHDGHTSWWNYWSLCGRPMWAVTQSKAHMALPQAVYRLLVLLQCPVPWFLAAQLVFPHASSVSNCLRWPTSAPTHSLWMVSSPHLCSTAPLDSSLYAHLCSSVFNSLLHLCDRVWPNSGAGSNLGC